MNLGASQYNKNYLPLILLFIMWHKLFAKCFINPNLKKKWKWKVPENAIEFSNYDVHIFISILIPSYSFQAVSVSWSEVSWRHFITAEKKLYLVLFFWFFSVPSLQGYWKENTWIDKTKFSKHVSRWKADSFEQYVGEIWPGKMP